MAYKALYRTWRPEQFSEVVGQDHIIRVLSGQIEGGRAAHAYLFAGPRGTGKTSLAKIFAKAINCTHRQGAEPCGDCDVCKETTRDSAVDIIEIDAASNNGVDSVREIRDRVNLLPAFCSHKVYIIDEVHMLSKGAFNALLKTLEEPPSHVIFILATTEPHKLPATIRSRCQRFDFKRIPLGIIAGRLKKVAEAEGYAFTEDALKMIARAAEGGMRDALSILDQCAAFGDVTPANVSSALGGSDIRMIMALADRITGYDEKGALETLREILDAGADTRTLIKDLSDVFRRMMWLSTGAQIEETDERLGGMAKTFGKNACIRALDILIQKEYEMRLNLRADIVLETAVMSIMCPEDDSASTENARLEKLEGRLKVLETQGIAPQALQQPTAESKPENGAADLGGDSGKKAVPKEPTSQAAQKKPAPQQTEKAQDVNIHKLWEKLLKRLKKDAYFVFTHAQKTKEVLVVGNVLELKYDSDEIIASDYMREAAAQKAVQQALGDLTDQPLAISIVIEKEQAQQSIEPDILEMFGDQIERI